MIAGWIVLSVLIGFLASSRGRNFFAWIIISLVISPLITLILLLLQADLRKEKLEDERHKEMISTLHNSSNNNDLKACPYCAESIKKDAVFCRFCQHSLT